MLLFFLLMKSNSVGMIVYIQDSIIIAAGLDNITYGEVVTFKKEPYFLNGKFANEFEGVIMNLEKNTVKIALFKGNQEGLKLGDKVYRTKMFLMSLVGFQILGQIVSAFGDVVEFVPNLPESDAYIPNLTSEYYDCFFFQESKDDFEDKLNTIAEELLIVSVLN